MDRAEFLKLELSRCMRGGFAYVTPTNFGTLGLFNNSKVGEILVVWSAYVYFGNIAEAGFGVFHGDVGGAVQASNSLWSRMAPVAGQVKYVDTATTYALDQHLPGGMFPNNAIKADIPWAIIDPGWSFVIQVQSNANPCSASVVWQSVLNT